MHHLCFDSAEQKWINYWVWKFSTDEVIHSAHMKSILKPSQNVGMWQAMLLSLNCVRVALNSSKNIFLGDDRHQCLHFLSESSCQQIMAMLWLLAWHHFMHVVHAHACSRDHL